MLLLHNVGSQGHFQCPRGLYLQTDVQLQLLTDTLGNWTPSGSSGSMSVLSRWSHRQSRWLTNRKGSRQRAQSSPVAIPLQNRESSLGTVAQHQSNRRVVSSGHRRFCGSTVLGFSTSLSSCLQPPPGQSMGQQSTFPQYLTPIIFHCYKYTQCSF